MDAVFKFAMSGLTVRGLQKLDYGGSEMTEISNLIHTLKQLLKERNIRQADVAASLNLGIARVKQMFTKNDFTIKRLAIICDEPLEMELGDLFRIAQERNRYIDSLTEEQEKQLTADIRLLVVAVSVLTNWSTEEITNRYQITERECRKHLKTLERLKLISVRDNGHIKLLINHNFHWIKDGPLENFFIKNIQSDFLNASFHKEGEIRLFRTGMLSTKSADELIKHVDSLVGRFVELDRDVAELSMDHRRGYSVVVAMRPWLMPAFTQLLRTPDPAGSQHD